MKVSKEGNDEGQKAAVGSGRLMKSEHPHTGFVLGGAHGPAVGHHRNETEAGLHRISSPAKADGGFVDLE